MKLITTHFTTPEPTIAGRTDVFHELFEVFKQSVKENIPEAEIVELYVESQKIKNKQRIIYTNHQKLLAWADYAQNMNEDVIFIDCDMLILGNLFEVFNLYEFDIAVTSVKFKKRIPFNGGVVFVRNTDKAKSFMKRWSEVDTEMFNNVIFHKKYKRKYQGMNQAALGYLYEEEKNIAKLIEVSCSRYNAIDDDWKEINENTPKEKIPLAIHYKGSLRKQLFENKTQKELERPLYNQRLYLINLWKQYKSRIPILK